MMKISEDTTAGAQDPKTKHGTGFEDEEEEEEEEEPI